MHGVTVMEFLYGVARLMVLPACCFGAYWVVYKVCCENFLDKFFGEDE